jgi:hypothetical protein
MTMDPRPILLLLDRIDRSARLETLCQEFDNGVAKAFRRDVRSLSWLLRSCPDLLGEGEMRDALIELRKRYLVVPSEFQDLIDQALRAVARLPRPADESGRAAEAQRLEELLDLAL